MRFPSKELVQHIKDAYPAGTRVELLQMDDPQAPPIGTRGTVIGVDDIGSIMVDWDNGNTGLTNMFDIPMVQRLAFERDYYDLVIYLEENRKEYVHFILTGEA